MLEGEFGDEHAPFTKEDGTLIWVKFGHLAGDITSPAAE